MNFKQSDPEFDNIMKNFIAKVESRAKLLSNKQKELIKIVSLVTQRSRVLLAEEVEKALSLVLTPVEMKEAIYQCTPYAGFIATTEALSIVNEVFEKNNIDFPLQKQSTVTQTTVFEKGLDAQTIIFGDSMRTVADDENTPNPYYYLITNCFGDYYTREGLDLQTREMLTLCILINLGTESQIKSHIQGNINIGHDKDFIEEMIYQCLPYAGYPRILNALNCFNEVVMK